MKLYLDTSALLRRYFREPESEEAVRLMNEPHVKIVSAVAFPDHA